MNGLPGFGNETEERADLLERIKVAANQRDVPYQSLIKVWLAERVDAMEPREELSASLRPDD